MIIPGLVSVTFKKLDVPSVLHLMEKTNLKAIEWSEGYHVHVDNLPSAYEVRKLCSEKQIEIVALGSYFKLGQNHDFTPILKLALALEAPTIRIWAGTKPSQAVNEATFVAMAQEAEAIARHCASKNIVIAFECHKDTLTDTNESTARLLALAPSCKSLWQPTVALSLEERKQGLKMLSQKLVNLHVYYMKGAVKRPLEEGKEEWKDYLSQVKGTHYALMEFVMGDKEEQFIEDALVLHQLVR
jgi:sugar phosphate isomerase/epimerase